MQESPGGRWPSQCTICHGWGWSRLCEACIGRFGAPRHRCRRCALPTPERVDFCGRCLVAPPDHDFAVAALDYAPPWDAVITHLKFHAALDLCGALADCLFRAVKASEAPPTALLLPTPASPRRLRERGYNQSWELTRRLARRLGVTASPDLLLRIRDTPPQLSLPLAERRSNVRDAFAVDPLRRVQLKGSRLAVIDDVMTTGATAAEMSRVLRAAGAAHVQIWVLARTPQPGS